MSYDILYPGYYPLEMAKAHEDVRVSRKTRDICSGALYIPAPFEDISDDYGRDRPYPPGLCRYHRLFGIDKVQSGSRGFGWLFWYRQTPLGAKLIARILMNLSQCRKRWRTIVLLVLSLPHIHVLSGSYYNLWFLESRSSHACAECFVARGTFHNLLPSSHTHTHTHTCLHPDARALGAAHIAASPLAALLSVRLFRRLIERRITHWVLPRPRRVHGAVWRVRQTRVHLCSC